MDSPEVQGKRLPAKAPDDIVKKAVILIEHPFPYYNNCDGTGNYRKIEYTAEKGTDTGTHLIDGCSDPQENAVTTGTDTTTIITVFTADFKKILS